MTGELIDPLSRQGTWSDNESCLRPNINPTEQMNRKDKRHTRISLIFKFDSESHLAWEILRSMLGLRRISAIHSRVFPKPGSSAKIPPRIVRELGRSGVRVPVRRS